MIAGSAVSSLGTPRRSRREAHRGNVGPTTVDDGETATPPVAAKLQIPIAKSQINPET